MWHIFNFSTFNKVYFQYLNIKFLIILSVRTLYNLLLSGKNVTYISNFSIELFYYKNIYVCLLFLHVSLLQPLIKGFFIQISMVLLWLFVHRLFLVTYPNLYNGLRRFCTIIDNHFFKYFNFILNNTIIIPT